MTHRFNGENTAHELARKGLPFAGTKVWCRGTQTHEHMTTVVD